MGLFSKLKDKFSKKGRCKKKKKFKKKYDKGLEKQGKVLFLLYLCWAKKNLRR